MKRNAQRAGAASHSRGWKRGNRASPVSLSTHPILLLHPFQQSIGSTSPYGLARGGEAACPCQPRGGARLAAAAQPPDVSPGAVMLHFTTFHSPLWRCKTYFIYSSVTVEYVHPTSTTRHTRLRQTPKSQLLSENPPGPRTHDDRPTATRGAGAGPDLGVYSQSCQCVRRGGTHSCMAEKAGLLERAWGAAEARRSAAVRRRTQFRTVHYRALEIEK